MAAWEDQLARVRRYHERFKAIRGGKAPNYESVDYWIDDIHTFFVHCFHVFDHIKNDPNYTKSNKSKLSEALSKPEMQLCSDICNGTKHLVRNVAPASGAQPQFTKKVYYANISQGLGGGEKATGGLTVYVQHGADMLDAFDVATNALKVWEDFVK
jgi:hypothetical protein